MSNNKFICKTCGSNDVFVLFTTIECNVCNLKDNRIHVYEVDDWEIKDIFDYMHKVMGQKSQSLFKINKINTDYEYYHNMYEDCQTYFSKCSLEVKSKYFVGKFKNVEIWKVGLIGWENNDTTRLLDSNEFDEIFFEEN